MKVAFFGLKKSIDYFQIGGTESFVRRLALRLVKNGIDVDYILYGNDVDKNLTVYDINLRYFRTLDDALMAIAGGEYDHVVTIYLLPQDRLKYALFKKKMSGTIFHFVYFNWPDSALKRNLYLWEARLFPYNGKLFCISKRQYEYVNSWSKNAVYILPAVHEDFFLKPEEKSANNKIRVTFLGRIDLGKGLQDVIEILHALQWDEKFECKLYGIRIPADKNASIIHNWLKEQKNISYIEVDRNNYSPAVEENVQMILRETDIFLQPYQRLSSTIDTPLLLLEAMAALCVVLTKPFGNIPDVYGDSRFIIQPDNFRDNAIKLLQGISFEEIVEERKRIYEQNNKLDFRASNVARRFVNAISE